MKKIRVIHIITDPYSGGAERLVRELNFRVKGDGIDSWAIYLTNDRNVALYKNEISLGLSNPRDIRAIYRIRSAIKKLYTPSDSLIIHAHLSWPFFFVPLSLFHINAILVYTEHNTYNKRRKYFFFKYIDRFFYKKYTVIICISLGVLKSLSAWLSSPCLTDRMDTIFNGSRSFESCYRGSTCNGKISILSIGSLSWQKGFDIGLEAVSLIKGQLREYVIVGSGEEKSQLIRIAESLGISQKVRFVGYQNCIEEYLTNANLLLIPSRWEGFGLVAIEALSAGIPIVAANIDGLNEVLLGCKAAYIVEKHNPLEFAEGIKKAITNLRNDKNIHNEARLHARKFNLNTMVNKYKNLYFRLASEKKL